MANPNTNTAEELQPAENPLGPEFAAEAVQRLDEIQNDRPGTELKMTSLAQPSEEAEPESGKVIEMTSLAQQKAAVETAPAPETPAPATPAAPAPKLVPLTGEASAPTETPAAPVAPAPAPAVLEESPEEGLAAQRKAEQEAYAAKSAAYQPTHQANAEQFEKEQAAREEVMKQAEGNYEAKDFAGQLAVQDTRRRVEATSKDLGQKAGEAVPMPEVGKLSKEQILAWFKTNREEFKAALAEAYGLSGVSKFMSDVELTDLMAAIQEGNKAGIDFVLKSWYKRVMGIEQEAQIDEDKVLTNIFSRIAENKPPEQLAA